MTWSGYNGERNGNQPVFTTDHTACSNADHTGNQSGRLLRRNLSHLHSTPEALPDTTPEPVLDGNTCEQQAEDISNTNEEPPGAQGENPTDYVTSTTRSEDRDRNVWTTIN